MKKFLILSFIALSVVFTSCEKDDHDHDNEEELITTLIYTLSASSGNVVMTFRDLDGDGGNKPVVTTVGNLLSGQEYIGSISVLNESVTPAVNITDEIEDEALEHQFFYAITGALSGKVNINYDDADSNNKPLGLKTKLLATTPGQGKLKVTLRHEPNKSGNGVANGDITNAGGETDIEVEFDIEVK